MEIVQGIALVLVCLLAIWWDIRERRVPNWLTVSGLFVALTLRAPDGLAAIALGLAGAMIGLALSVPFFMTGGLGGGDVKLLTAIGAFLGPGRIWFGLLVMALVGGLMAVVVIARNRAFLQTAVNMRVILATLGAKTFRGWKGEGEGAVTLDTPGVLTVPYAVAIATGAVASWYVYGANPDWSLTQTLAGWMVR